MKRPPFFSTRKHSPSALNVSVTCSRVLYARKLSHISTAGRTLRRPNAIVTASKEASSKGSASADASQNSSEMLLEADGA